MSNATPTFHVSILQKPGGQWPAHWLTIWSEIMR